MTHPAILATRYARRPLLLEPGAARELLHHLALSDPRGMTRMTRLDAVLSRVGLGRGRTPVQAMDQEDEAAQEAPTRPQCYAPLWAQQAYGDPQDEGFAWSLYAGVAMMEVNTAISDRGEYFCGTWYHGYDTILAALKEATADERVKGVLIRAYSPGGVVAAGLPALAKFMREARAAAGGKPIFVYADAAFSAMYYIAASGDQIWASKVGLVGSIGAVWVHMNEAGALAKGGIEVTSIEFPVDGSKTDGAGWKALSPTAKADLQAEVTQCGEDFLADVVLGRPNLTVEGLAALKARCFMGDHADPARSALKLGLIDALGTEEECFQALLATISEPGSAPPANAGAVTAVPVTTAAIKPTKETLMAQPGPQNPALAAERAQLEARLAEITAEEQASSATEALVPSDPADPDEDEDETDDPDAATDPDAAPKPPMDAQPAAQAPAAAIAASAEAKANPALALEAIKADMTLEQFQAMAALAPAGGRKSALAEAMANSKRLPPDAAKPQGGLGGVLLASAKKMAGEKV